MRVLLNGNDAGLRGASGNPGVAGCGRDVVVVVVDDHGVVVVIRSNGVDDLEGVESPDIVSLDEGVTPRDRDLPHHRRDASVVSFGEIMDGGGGLFAVIECVV